MSTETLDASAVREVERLTLATTPPVTIGGKDYSRVELYDPRKAEVEPATLGLSTLESLVEYLTSDHDDAYRTKRGLFLHVEGPTSVRLCTDLFGEFNQRVVLARAKAIVPEIRFNDWTDPETFNILLQAYFEDTAGRAAALALVGSLKDEAVRTLEDDGVTQQATARRGLNLAANVKVPNPVTLRPYRSFTEIAQVESPFVLRLRGGGSGSPPTCALFEADGGLWRLTAIARIKAWLTSQLEGGCEVFG